MQQISKSPTKGTLTRFWQNQQMNHFEAAQIPLRTKHPSSLLINHLSLVPPPFFLGSARPPPHPPHLHPPKSHVHVVQNATVQHAFVVTIMLWSFVLWINQDFVKKATKKTRWVPKSVHHQDILSVTLSVHRTPVPVPSMHLHLFQGALNNRQLAWRRSQNGWWDKNNKTVGGHRNVSS